MLMESVDGKYISVVCTASRLFCGCPYKFREKFCVPCAFLLYAPLRFSSPLWLCFLFGKDRGERDDIVNADVHSVVGGGARQAVGYGNRTD
jgi:hypothetical protein